MVSSGEFWVAISYRLAAYFTSESEVCVELKFTGNHSGILGATMTLWGKFRRKMTKMGQKLIKIVLSLLYVFRIYSLKKFLRLVDWPPPCLRP